LILLSFNGFLAKQEEDEEGKKNKKQLEENYF